MQGKNSKNKENLTINYIFETVRRCNETEKFKPLRGTMCIANFNLSTKFGGEICEEQIQNVRKPHPKKYFSSLESGVMGPKS